MPQVRILLDAREVYAGTLQPLKQSSTGKSVILAQSSDKIQAPPSLSEAFARIGWSFTMFGLPHKTGNGAK